MVLISSPIVLYCSLTNGYNLIFPDGLFGEDLHGMTLTDCLLLQKLVENWAGELRRDKYLSPYYFSSGSENSDCWAYYQR